MTRTPRRAARAALLAAALPLLQGCLAGLAAVQAVPMAIGSVAMANAPDRDPWRRYGPEPYAAADDELEALDAQIRRAECGDARSQYALAATLQRNGYTHSNDVEIYKWYLLAEAAESGLASEALRELDVRMAPSDIDIARRRAKGWRASVAGCERQGA